MTISREVMNTTLSGQIIDPVIISASELTNLRHARQMFDELRDLLSSAVIPAIGGMHHPVSARVHTLLGEVHLRSGGFLASYWREAERFASAKEVAAHVSH